MTSSSFYSSYQLDVPLFACTECATHFVTHVTRLEKVDSLKVALDERLIDFQLATMQRAHLNFGEEPRLSEVDAFEKDCETESLQGTLLLYLYLLGCTKMIRRPAFPLCSVHSMSSCLQ